MGEILAPKAPEWGKLAPKAPKTGEILGNSGVGEIFRVQSNGGNFVVEIEKTMQTSSDGFVAISILEARLSR